MMRSSTTILLDDKEEEATYFALKQSNSLPQSPLEHSSTGLEQSPISESALSLNASTTLEPSSSEEKSPNSAIDPETGAINWDCPCLARAVEPPCGEYFKAAFACFVASQTEPKGEDCLDHFVRMNSCYLAHPEIYNPNAKEANAEEATREAIQETVPNGEAQ
jgi:mitochondrial intermembrane space import and assembly protein 40